jgi:hypothetical protein
MIICSHSVNTITFNQEQKQGDKENFKTRRRNEFNKICLEREISKRNTDDYLSDEEITYKKLV